MGAVARGVEFQFYSRHKVIIDCCAGVMIQRNVDRKTLLQ
jgi:hypothetical protein